MHKLSLPRPSRFLPQKFSFVEGVSSRVTRLTIEHNWCLAWHRCIFNQPRAAASIYFHFSFTASGSVGAVLTHLFCQFVLEELGCAFEAQV